MHAETSLRTEVLCSWNYKVHQAVLIGGFVSTLPCTRYQVPYTLYCFVRIVTETMRRENLSKVAVALRLVIELGAKRTRFRGATFHHKAIYYHGFNVLNNWYNWHNSASIIRCFFLNSLFQEIYS